MKKITLIKTFLIACLLATSTVATAQVEFKMLTGFGTRFNDVNDNGIGVLGGGYYDFATEELTPVEDEATGTVSINNDNNVAGDMFLDEPNFILQPAVRLNGVWTPIGYFPESVPSESSYTTYGISPNSKYVTGQMSIGCCDFGTFLYDTETQELFSIFDPGGEALAGYVVSNDGTIGGWLDQPNNSGTLRIPAFFNKEGVITLLPNVGANPDFSSNSVDDITETGLMAGGYDGRPFIYDRNTQTFTQFDTPGGNPGTFTGISENGIAIGYEDTAFQVREAIMYAPGLMDQPRYVKEVLADFGIIVDTFDESLGTGYKISPDGNYLAGWVNGPPIFAEGWMVNFDNMLLGVQNNNIINVSYYPNPVKDVLNLATASTIQAVTVTNITGQQLNNVVLKENNTRVDISALQSGVYFVNVSTNAGSETVKVIKE